MAMWSGRLEEVTVAAQSTMVGENLGKLGIRDTVGCLILALRMAAGFVNNPGSDVELSEGTILIAMGTPTELMNLRSWASG